jgi:hypothetical protein
MEPSLTLVTTKSDAELAAEFRERLSILMAPVLELLDEAQKNRINIQYAVGLNAFGKNAIVQLNLVKVL